MLYSTLLRISLCLILLVSLANAYRLGSDVTQIELNFSEENEVCQNISIFGDFKGIIFIEDRWSNIKSKNLGDYILDSRDAGIKINYESSFYLNDASSIRVCFLGDKFRTYNGVLLFSSIEKRVGVGIWVNSFENERIYLKINEVNRIIFWQFLFLEIFTSLFATLLLFIAYRKRKSFDFE